MHPLTKGQIIGEKMNTEMTKNITVKVDGKKLRNVEIVFLKRISGNGELLIQLDLDYKPTLFKNFTAECLSITHKTWIASDGMSFFIVKLRNQATGHYLPIC